MAAAATIAWSSYYRSTRAQQMRKAHEQLHSGWLGHVSWKRWRAINPSPSSGRESSCYQRAYGNPMSSALVLCIVRSMVIAQLKGSLAFITDTQRGV